MLHPNYPTPNLRLFTLINHQSNFLMHLQLCGMWCQIPTKPNIDRRTYYILFDENFTHLLNFYLFFWKKLNVHFGQYGSNEQDFNTYKGPYWFLIEAKQESKEKFPQKQGIDVSTKKQFKNKIQESSKSTNMKVVI